MRLRNKKTGDIWEFDGISMAISDSTKEKLGARGCSGACYARSLSELNEEWEDCIPAEPLIKDEKIRKAVKAWAEANNAEKVAIQNNYCLSTEDDEDVEIVFASPIFKDIDDDDFYTIAELCGEEEE